MDQAAQTGATPASAFEKFAAILGGAGVEFNASRIAGETENTLGYHVPVLGILYPRNVHQVMEIVRAANEHKTPLYPISRGANIGYGEKSPAAKNQVVVDLRRMNAVRKYNEIEGNVTVEPGVTQKQLYEFLRACNAPFRMDATGAGLLSSIIGNSLEGGFGHTPNGNRRKSITDIEAVLGNGRFLRTGVFPGLGPDLAGLFVQSNFGIVTAATIALMPAPESFSSFVLTVHDELKLEELIAGIHDLRKRGVLTSLVHIGNALRSFMTTSRCPEQFMDKVMTAEDAINLMSSAVLRVGRWSAAGALYGSEHEIRTKMRTLKKAMAGIGRITFFTDRKIDLLERISLLPGVRKSNAFRKIGQSLSSYRHIHELMQGIPSDEALKNIGWRVAVPNEMGLIWYAPVIPAVPSLVAAVMAAGTRLFAEHKFEFPATLTFVTPSQLIGVMGIHFNRRNEEEKKAAYRLYYSLKKEMSALGVGPYRHGLLGMDEIRYEEEGKHQTLHEMKRTFDPNNIIAPGRYNI